MTTPNSTDPRGAADDDGPHTFQYGHGRLPTFLKLVWLAFLAFGAWYVAVYLLDALGGELGAG